MAKVQRQRQGSVFIPPAKKQVHFRDRSASQDNIRKDLTVPSQKYLSSRRRSLSHDVFKRRGSVDGGVIPKCLQLTECSRKMKAAKREGEIRRTGSNSSMVFEIDEESIFLLSWRYETANTTTLNNMGKWNPTMNMIREKEKQDLQSKVTELEEYKIKYEEEKKEKQILQNRLSELMTGQSNTTQNLMRANESLDRLRLDQKKKIEQIEKMQRDLAFKDDRIRNLEIRASEVEKAELILETTKQNLESTVQEVRTREGEIRRLQRDIDDKDRQLEILSSTNTELEAKVDDLKLQVRHELMKNDNVEKNLETIPRLKDTIHDKDVEIEQLKQQINEKIALLNAARKAARDYKEKLRNIQNEISKTEMLKEDLHLTQAEVVTLKKLMYGKDYLVTQKSKALDLSKEIIGVLNGSTDYEQNERVQQLLDRLDNTTRKSRKSSTSNTRTGSESSRSDQSDYRPPSCPPSRQRSSTPLQVHYQKDIDVNHYPYSMENEIHSNQNNIHSNQNGHSHNQVFLKRVMIDSHAKRKRPMSAAPHVSASSNKSAFHRTSSLKEAHKIYTSPLPRKSNAAFEREYLQNSRPNSYKSDSQNSSKFRPSLEYNIGPPDNGNESELMSECNSPRGYTQRSNGEVFSDNDSLHSNDSELEETMTPEQEAPLRSLTAREKDAILQAIVSVGDRVLFTRQQKPPKYGKKKVLKPINYTGIVKFIGKFDADKNKYDARVYVGVRMDDQVGDTDGSHKGKRYMYVPTDQGKFYKAREITSVLNVKTGRYISIQRLMLKHLQRQAALINGNKGDHSG